MERILSSIGKKSVQKSAAFTLWCATKSAVTLAIVMFEFQKFRLSCSLCVAPSLASKRFSFVLIHGKFSSEAFTSVAAYTSGSVEPNGCNGLAYTHAAHIHAHMHGRPVHVAPLRVHVNECGLCGGIDIAHSNGWIG